MELEQAIKTAIQYETRVRDVYQKLAQKTDDAVGKRVLRVLAGEEQQHLDYLKNKLNQWTQTGRISPVRLESSVPPKEVIAASLKKMRSDVSRQVPAGELERLNQVLEAEKETSTFYRQMVQELDAQGQALFEQFFEIEQSHLAVVQAEIDQLRGLGYWFDFREFDLEAG